MIDFAASRILIFVTGRVCQEPERVGHGPERGFVLSVAVKEQRMVGALQRETIEP